MIELSEVGPAENDLVAYDVTLSLPLMIDETFVVEDIPLVGSLSIDLRASGIVMASDRIQVPGVVQVSLQPGDANQDLSFDQRDIVRVLTSNKYLSGTAATWGEGDWNGAPGGSPGSPPSGDDQFNQVDIISALLAGNYLTGPYSATDIAAPTNAIVRQDIPFANIPEPSALVSLVITFGLCYLVGAFRRSDSA